MKAQKLKYRHVGGADIFRMRMRNNVHLNLFYHSYDGIKDFFSVIFVCDWIWNFSGFFFFDKCLRYIFDNLFGNDYGTHFGHFFGNFFAVPLKKIENFSSNFF